MRALVSTMALLALLSPAHADPFFRLGIGDVAQLSMPDGDTTPPITNPGPGDEDGVPPITNPGPGDETDPGDETPVGASAMVIEPVRMPGWSFKIEGLSGVPANLNNYYVMDGGSLGPRIAVMSEGADGCVAGFMLIINTGKIDIGGGDCYYDESEWLTGDDLRAGWIANTGQPVPTGFVVLNSAPWPTWINSYDTSEILWSVSQ